MALTEEARAALETLRAQLVAEGHPDEREAERKRDEKKGAKRAGNGTGKDGAGKDSASKDSASKDSARKDAASKDAAKKSAPKPKQPKKPKQTDKPSEQSKNGAAVEQADDGKKDNVSPSRSKGRPGHGRPKVERLSATQKRRLRRKRAHERALTDGGAEAKGESTISATAPGEEPAANEEAAVVESVGEDAGAPAVPEEETAAVAETEIEADAAASGAGAATGE